MAEFIMRYWIEFVFTGLISVAGFSIKRLFIQYRALRCGMQAILRDRIIQSYYHYKERGNISLHGLENVNALYKEYHNLGGNGTITKLVEDLRELPVVDD